MSCWGTRRARCAKPALGATESFPGDVSVAWRIVGRASRRGAGVRRPRRESSRGGPVTREATPGYAARRARSDDLATLPEVERAASQLFRSTDYPEIAAERPTTVEELALWLERGALFVAVDERDTPVGFAIAFALDGDAYLHELDVHPRHGRRGVGRMLVEFVRSWAARCGHARLTLSTFADVAWNAPYYRRLGFRELRAEELGPDLREVRRRETAAGLKADRRVFMVVSVGRPD
jgi:GNAT superfamily N-acetyltransferase